MADLVPFVDPDTEAELLAGLVQRVPAALGSGLLHVLNESQFSVPSYKWLVQEVLTTSNDPPPWPLLHQRIVDGFADLEVREKHVVALQRLYTLKTDWLAGALESFRRFVAFQATSASVRKFYEGFQRSKNVELSLRVLQDEISSATHIMEGGQLEIVDYGAGWTTREALRKRKRDNPELYPRLKIGIARFDSQIKMEAGTVTNFLAPAKRHKSIMLASLAYAAVLQGFNVALVPVENSIDLTVNRLDAMFLQLNYERVCSYLKTRAEKEYADQIFARIDSWPQRLKIIKGLPQKTGTVEVARALRVLRDEEGFEADVKIYDYLNIMKPSIAHKLDDWQAQTQIVWDLHEEAVQASHPAIVITASQTKVDGLAKDKEGKPVRVQADQQGRSLGITQGVDSTVAIDMEPGHTDEFGNSSPPVIILSPLYMRDGVITDPEIRLVSEIDRMCIDREQRRLWSEVEDGQNLLPFPSDSV